MTTLNKNTKKAQGFINSFIRAKELDNVSIFDIYDRPSINKMTMADNIEYLAGKDRATVYYMRGNNFYFTCGYYREVNQKAELIIYTKSNIYQILL